MRGDLLDRQRAGKISPDKSQGFGDPHIRHRNRVCASAEKHRAFLEADRERIEALLPKTPA